MVGVCVAVGNSVVEVLVVGECVVGANVVGSYVVGEDEGFVVGEYVDGA